MPPGFGPPQQGAAGPREGGDTPGPSVSGRPAHAGTDAQAPGPGHPTPSGPGTSPQDVGRLAPGSTAPTGSMNPGRAAPRRKGRVLLAAAAVTVVLAAAGTTIALLGDDSGGKETGTRTGAVGGGPSEPNGPDDGSNAPRSTEQGDAEDRAPSEKTADQKDPEPTGRATTPAPEKPTGGATAGGGSTPGGGPGGGATTGGGSTTPAPACHAIGGGKYNCQVWKTADSYTAAGAKAGILKAGTNYFYCQQNLGRRETSGEWTNVWWAKTDDDSGNTDVWVSDVYIKGGDNDGPVPGLPVC
ncbi:hypothetical protein ABT116_38325 [Streptomyces sp. NPDC002130]|uniref:hypothetical protein n=1 Tax=Streptomyces sp. NPDC002130 TaxID=3155568 RepID=UPI003321AFEF